VAEHPRNQAGTPLQAEGTRYSSWALVEERCPIMQTVETVSFDDNVT
jgi:hypothetical protein